MYKAKLNSNVTASVSTTPPPGSIMAYLGTTDPDGWVIANGVARTDGGADGRYYNLIQMNIYAGTLANNSLANYTPPDLGGAFLRGAGVCKTNSNYNGGTIKNTQTDTVGAHAHSANFSHTHTYDEYYATAAGGGARLVFDGQNVSAQDYGWIQSVGNGYAKRTTDASTASGTTDSTGSIETRPYNYGVNWIIKL